MTAAPAAPALASPPVNWAAVAVALIAIAPPTLLAYNVSPSPTVLNQALALGGWGLWVAFTQPMRPSRALLPLLAALGLLAATAAGSWLWAGLPASLALSALGLIAAAAVVSAGGAGARGRPDAESLFAAFCWALAITGAANVVVAVLQVFTPDLPDGDWLAVSGFPGRAVGNLRQPNHLSSLLLWSCIAVVGLVELRQIRRAAAWLWGAALVFAVVLTASRTGLVSVLLLALWGGLDRRLSRATRGGLIAAPLVYAVCWWGMAQWAAASAHAFGGVARLAETDISASRFGIWANTLTMIRQQPWTGVGFGNFNFAWTLTPFPGRPTAFFDHTHNLALQFAVELGLPLAALVMGLLMWALCRSVAVALRPADPRATADGLPLAQRCAVMVVLMIGLHSMLEYPVWYAYFLLPAAWAWGFALPSQSQGAARTTDTGAAMPWPALGLAGLAVVAGGVLTVLDYQRVVAVFSAPDTASPLEQRIVAGQRSLFFSHHADYAAVTTGVPLADSRTAYDRVTHYLLDTRLMVAWARALAERGELDAARHLAQRLREFRKTDAAEFFDECQTPPADPPAFQCQPPARTVPWREFLPQR